MQLLREMKKVISLPWLSFWVLLPTRNMWSATLMTEGFSQQLGFIWTPCL